MERGEREQLLTRKSGQEVDEKGLFVDKKREQEEGREEKDEDEEEGIVGEGRKGYVVE